MVKIIVTVVPVEKYIISNIDVGYVLIVDVHRVYRVTVRNFIVKGE